MIPFERVPPSEKVPSFLGLELNLTNREMKYKGKYSHLTESEYQVIWFLIRNKENATLNTELEEFLFDKYSDDQDLPLGNNLQVFLTRINKKLRELTDGKIVINNVGKSLGYKIEENV